MDNNSATLYKHVYPGFPDLTQYKLSVYDNGSSFCYLRFVCVSSNLKRVIKYAFDNNYKIIEIISCRHVGMSSRRFHTEGMGLHPVSSVAADDFLFPD